MRVDGRDEWSTPDEVYQQICDHWRLKPLLDVCADVNNAKCDDWITHKLDALNLSWHARLYYNSVAAGLKPVAWMNPPYSQPTMTRFIEKAIAESKRGVITVFLLPAFVDQAWYHDLIKHYPHEFWRGRIKFNAPPGIKASSPRYGNVHGVISDPAAFAWSQHQP